MIGKKQEENSNMLIYLGYSLLYDDLIINENGKQILLPKEKSSIKAIIIQTNEKSGIEKFEQPRIIVDYNNKNYEIPLKYIYYKGKLVDFNSGINATSYIYPLIREIDGIPSFSSMGAVMYLSPRLMKGMFTQLYILNDPFNNFPNFELVHIENDLYVEILKEQILDVPEIIFYGDYLGPIKIWEIKYTGKEEFKEEYLDTDASKYLTWKL